MVNVLLTDLKDDSKTETEQRNLIEHCNETLTDESPT